MSLPALNALLLLGRRGIVEAPALAPGAGGCDAAARRLTLAQGAPRHLLPRLPLFGKLSPVSLPKRGPRALEPGFEEALRPA